MPTAHEVHKDEPEVDELPSAHRVHELEPPTLLNFPVSQAVHVVKSVILKNPAAQFKQLDCPAVEYCPATQEVQAEVPMEAAYLP